MFSLRLIFFSAILCLFTGAANANQPSVTNSGNFPLAFVKQGTGYRAQGQGYSIGLDGNAATIHTEKETVAVRFAGGRATAAVEGKRLSGVVNYISGNDPAKWQVGLSTFERVTYPEVYPGIDAIFYGNQQQLEFDLVLKPGADPRAIRMKVQGGGKLAMDSEGNLTIGGGLHIGLPGIYQNVNGVRKTIDGRFAIRGTDEVAFQVEKWDRTRALVIDPTIVYSTLLTGGLGSSTASGIAIDSSGNLIVAGDTTAADFPAVNAPSAFAPNNGFISKLKADGSGFIYSTFFGGSSGSIIRGVAVDSTGSAWITGYTSSTGFPLVNAAQSSGVAFLAKFDQSGVPQFSTYLGNFNSSAYGIAVDPSGNGYVTGTTANGGPAFPTTPGVLQSPPSGNHAFVSKYSPSGTVIYSTLLGGSGADSAYAIAADSNGDSYITGTTTSSSFIGATASGAQTANNGNGDAFVAKLKSDGSTLLYFTFLGGSSSDIGSAITVDSSLNAYVTGTTSSTGLATPGAAQTAPGGAADGFVAKVNGAGNVFSYVTYLGGNRQDYPKSLAIDPAGNVYVTGSTESPNFPLVSAVEPVLGASTSSLYTSSDSGGTWSVSDNNIPGAVLDLSLNPAGTSAVVATESGIYRTMNGGTSWAQQVNMQSAAIAMLSRSPVAPATIYASACCGNSPFQFYRSADDGISWSSSSAPGLPSQIIADPVSANTVYFRSGSQFWKSTNSGATWVIITSSLRGTVADVVATPDGALYAAVGENASSGADIYKSTNQGTTWLPLNVGLPFFTNFFAHALSASGNTVYLAASSVYETTDGGNNWSTEPGATGLYQLAVSPKNPAVQYALTGNATVEESTDGGVTWNSPGQKFAAGSSLGGNRIIPDPLDPTHVWAIAPVSAVAFAAKLSKDGSAFAWSTFLGGSFSASGSGIATDGAGNAYITGSGSGVGFPLTSQTPQAFSSAFVTKISDATGNCAPVLSGGDQTITGGSQTLYFSVIAPSGCSWSASTTAGWVTIVSGAAGTGSAPVTVQVATNTGSATRNATLKAGSTSVNISQAANSCSYSLDLPPSPYPADPPAYGLPIAGGNVTAVMTATAGCPWTVVNPYPTAITITSGASGTGNGTVQLTVSPNNVQNLLRTFSLPVGTTTIRIEELKDPPQTQLIFFTAIPDQTLDFAPPPLSATADSQFPVTFTSNTPSVCQVSGTAVTLTATGTCSITANQPGNVLWLPAAPVTNTFKVTAGPAVPQPTGGIANAASASAAPASVVSIGSYIAIYGHALADNSGPSSATTIPLPLSLNGTQATLGGLPMPLLYAGTGQINALVPMSLKPGQSYPLVVTRDNIPSAPVSLTVVQLQPGIYTVGANGIGTGIITNALTGQLINSANPARAGDYLTVWCTGLGTVHGPNGEAGPADGAAPQTGLIYYTDVTVTASIEGINAPVLFSGLAPGFAALYQVNIQVPSIGVQEGTVYTLTITAKNSQTAGISNSNSVSAFVK